MFSKPLKSRNQQVLEILLKRRRLSNAEQKTLHILDSGYEGEMQFYQILNQELHNEPIKLFNVHLKINGSECQIDALLIFQNEIILFEVKNYQGDFIIEGDQWYTLSKQEIRNPLHQLRRTELLLHQFLTMHNLSLKVRSFVVFIHPEFKLYQTPPHIPAVFLPQMKRFLNQIQNSPCKIENRHEQIAKLLTSKHINSSAFESIEEYDYESLQKGVFCEKCSGTMNESGLKYMLCSQCSSSEDYNQSILRNIKDFHTLFPHEKITLIKIHDWLDRIVSKYKIRNTFSDHLTIVGTGRGAHYIFKD